MLEASQLVVRYGKSTVVSEVDLTLRDGPCAVGLVGESGSGKTTVARALLRLVPPASGQVLYDGTDIGGLRGREWRAFRRSVQMVFQDADGTLDPRMRVGKSIEEVLRAHHIVGRQAMKKRVQELLNEVGLDSAHGDRLPRQLSGGQRQRISLARALAVEPRALVLDEPTSALDVTAQARILTLIERIRTERKLAYLLISHNLAVVERLCDSIAVMYGGRIVERGSAKQILSQPRHPYTVALRSAVPQMGPARPAQQRVPLRDMIPNVAADPAGCVLFSRCPLAIDRCAQETPVAPRSLTRTGSRLPPCRGHQTNTS